MDPKDVGDFPYGKQPGETPSPIWCGIFSVYHRTLMYMCMHPLSKNVNGCHSCASLPEKRLAEMAFTG